MHQHVIAKPPRDKGGILFVYLFHKGFHHPALQKRGARFRRLLHHGKKPVKTLVQGILRHLIFHRRRRGACPRGIDEREGVVKLYLPHHVDGLFHVLRRFPRKPHDQVCGDRNVGNRRFQLIHQRQILRLRVAPVHRLQNAVGTCLQRQMQMTADLRRTPHDLDQLVRQILRMRCHKADAPQSLNVLHLLQKFRKGHGIFQIFSVGVDVLPKQHDFRHAVLHKRFDLTQDILRLPAPLPPAHIGHDTIAAKIIAAKHNVHAGLIAVLAFYRQIFHDFIRPLPDIHNHIFGRKSPCKKFGKLKNVVGAKDQIHKPITFPYVFNHGVFLHHAAAERDFEMRFLFFQTV